MSKVCLICIDGWGLSTDPPSKEDAIAGADTPYMDKFRKEYPYCELEASGLAVGLSEGLMGNSEVGHLNIGAGRVVWQDIVRIDQSVKTDSFLKQENIAKALQAAKDGNGRIHFLGLVSDGGVHSHINHLLHLLDKAKQENVPNAYVHFFGDGRDVDAKSSDKYLKQLLDKMADIKYGKLGTVVGRYYAMDRDKRWDRVELALKALIQGEGTSTDDPIAVIKDKFSKDETDEFLKPIIVNGDEARIKSGDSLFFFNYRSDRMREIVQIIGVDSSPLPDLSIPEDLHITTMTRYKTDFTFPIAFPPQHMGNVLAEWLSKKKIKQCHIAETEKYAHVTFFFNGGIEKQFELEDRDMIPSPKVATYDKDPKMSVHGVADKVIERVNSKEHQLVLCNLAPPDMVGHTGIYDAAVEAVTHTDQAIGAIYEACEKNDYILFVTADHGNAEDCTITSHTTNPVPFNMCTHKHKLTKDKGILGDVAPTILKVMGVDQPKEMEGTSLV